MSLLDTCINLWGSDDIVETDPVVLNAKNVIYVPFRQGSSWGLFDKAGIAIRDSVDFRGPDQSVDEKILTTDVSKLDMNVENSFGAFIYGGTINPHFGHFLVNTLPRYWNIVKIRTPNTPILCHGPGRVEDWFAVPFIKSAFGLLGLSANDFTSFDRAALIKSIVIPGTSLEEQRAGFRAYRRLCLGIGDRACASQSLEKTDRPVYYSKSRLKSAVGIIVNEVEMEDTFQSNGVDIVYPEELNLVDQIRLMSSRINIMGSAGSFLHTSIFCPGRRITCLNVTSQINSNYTIIDKLSENISTYNYPTDMKVLQKQEGFITSRRIPNPLQVARELIELMRSSQ